MPSERFGRRERAQVQALVELAPTRRELQWRDVARIDRERLWWALRGMDRGDLMELVVRALTAVPSSDLERVLCDQVRAGDVGATPNEQPVNVRLEVQKFYDLARRGHFYEVVPYRGRDVVGDKSQPLASDLPTS